MIGLDKEVSRIAQQPSDERVRALKRIIPCSTIKSILKQCGQVRYCARLPKWFMVWFVIGMGLFATDCYRQIYRWLQAFRPKGVPQRTTLCEARQRLGVAPLRWLRQRIVRLLANLHTPGAFHRNLRLMALDGFVVDLPDTPTNADTFGRPQGGRTPGAFPQARVLALCEVGTHVLWQCLIKPIRRAETVMARTLLRHLDSDMLLMWDRGLLSYANVQAVRDRQAQLLARIRKTHIFPRLKVLRDGSYLSRMYASSKHRRHDCEGLDVRVIEYKIHDSKNPGKTTVHRLLTTLLDARLDPAKELIELYHQRWEEELTIDELKTHQRQRPVLRSQTPAGVVQEIEGLLLAHFVVRTLMFEAAAQAKVAPLRISFTGTLKILRCRLPECPHSRRGLERWYQKLLVEIAEEILPPRRDRINPRVIRRKMSKWAKKTSRHRKKSMTIKKFRESIEIVR